MNDNIQLPQMNFYKTFFQLAYITTDLQQSVKIFGDLYGVRDFQIVPEPITKEVQRKGQRVSYTVKLAFGQVGDHQIELIEPVEDETGCYIPLLPAAGFGQLFHHIGCKFAEQKEWDNFRSTLDTELHPIAFEFVEGPTKFLYLDERKNLGHFVEYMWLPSR